MPYKVKFKGTTYFDGFKRQIKPMPEDGIYSVVGKGEKGVYHLLKEGDSMRNRISINMKYFELFKIKEDEL